MPISYKVMEISQLFQKIKDPLFNHLKAAEHFRNALDEYCMSKGCRRPTPDKPEPPPAKSQISKTASFGGSGGGPFEISDNSTTFNLQKVLLRTGANIDNIQLMLGDGVKTKYTPSVGGVGGGPQVWQVPDGEFVTQVEYRSDKYLHGLTFITNKGHKSPAFGSNIGDYHIITIPEEWRIVGMYGRCGQYVDQLGFKIAKTIYDAKTESSEIFTVKLTDQGIESILTTE